MKPALLIFPFSALIIAALGAALHNANPDQLSYGWAAYALAVGLFAAWVALDLNGFKRLISRRGSKYGVGSLVNVALVLLVIAGLGFLSNRPRFDKSYDATRTGSNTLAEQTEKILSDFRDESVELKVIGFFEDEQVRENFRNLLEKYQRIYSDISVEFVIPNEDPLRAKSEEITSPNTVLVRSGDQTETITTFNEEKLTNALVRVRKTVERNIYFLRGHGEGELDSTSDERGYGFITSELKKSRYKVEGISLLEKGSVPENADMVVISGAKYDLSEEEVRMVNDHVNRGGALLVMANAMAPVAGLNKILQPVGLGFEDDFIMLRPGDPRSQLYGPTMTILTELDAAHAITKDFGRESQVDVVVFDARSVKKVDGKSEITSEMIAKTSSINVRVNNVKGADDLKGLTEDRLDDKGPFNIIGVANGKVTVSPPIAENEQDSKTSTDGQKNSAGAQQDIRVVAIGSTFLAVNRGATLAKNRDMMINVVNYLLRDEDLISIRPKDSTKSTLNVASSGSQLNLYILSLIYPFLFLAGSVYFWMRRRNA